MIRPRPKIIYTRAGDRENQHDGSGDGLGGRGGLGLVEAGDLDVLSPEVDGGLGGEWRLGSNSRRARTSRAGVDDQPMASRAVGRKVGQDRLEIQNKRRKTQKTRPRVAKAYLGQTGVGAGGRRGAEGGHGLLGELLLEAGKSRSGHAGVGLGLLSTGDSGLKGVVRGLDLVLQHPVLGLHDAGSGLEVVSRTGEVLNR